MNYKDVGAPVLAEKNRMTFYGVEFQAGEQEKALHSLELFGFKIEVKKVEEYVDQHDHLYTSGDLYIDNKKIGRVYIDGLSVMPDIEYTAKGQDIYEKTIVEMEKEALKTYSKEQLKGINFNYEDLLYLGMAKKELASRNNRTKVKLGKAVNLEKSGGSITFPVNEDSDVIVETLVSSVSKLTDAKEFYLLYTNKNADGYILHQHMYHSLKIQSKMN